MSLREKIRESAFNLARHDLALFLEEHEDDLLAVFREEMQRLDDEIPEENVFIDLDMVGIGDTLLKAVLRALRRFLTEEPGTSGKTVIKVQAAETDHFLRRKSQ